MAVSQDLFVPGKPLKQYGLPGVFPLSFFRVVQMMVNCQMWVRCSLSVGLESKATSAAQGRALCHLPHNARH